MTCTIYWLIMVFLTSPQEPDSSCILSPGIPPVGGEQCRHPQSTRHQDAPLTNLAHC